MRKKDIKKYYKLEPQMDLKGKVKEVPVYIGGYYEFGDEAFAPDKAAKRIGIPALLIMILLLAVAAPDPAGLRQIYIALPYIFILLPATLLVSVGIGLWGVKERMTEVQYHDIIVRGKSSAMALCILSGYCIVADLIFFIVQFAQINLWKEILFIIINIISLLLGYVQLKYIKVLNKQLTFYE